jgi:hypothetical protein
MLEGMFEHLSMLLYSLVRGEMFIASARLFNFPKLRRSGMFIFRSYGA